MGHSGFLQKQDRAIQKNHSADLRPEKSSHEKEVSLKDETPWHPHTPRAVRTNFTA